MKFREVSENVLIGYQYTKHLRMFEEFENSGFAVVQLDWKEDGYKSVTSAQSSVSQSAKRFKKGNIKLTTRGDDLYMINTLLVGSVDK